MSEEPTGLSTRVSLLRRLREGPDDRSAWSEFDARYRPLLQAWGRDWGLQAADAEDVSQAVLLRLAVKLRQFEYDPARSFRGWLRTVARNVWLDFAADLRRQPREPGDPLHALEQQAAGQDLEQRLASLFDLEILEEASNRVRERVEPRTWEAFHRASVQGEETRAVAEALGLSTASVFRARSLVRKMLQEEVARLEKGPTG